MRVMRGMPNIHCLYMTNKITPPECGWWYNTFINYGKNTVKPILSNHFDKKPTSLLLNSCDLLTILSLL